MIIKHLYYYYCATVKVTVKVSAVFHGIVAPSHSEGIGDEGRGLEPPHRATSWGVLPIPS